VSVVKRWIVAVLLHRAFFSLVELNRVIREKCLIDSRVAVP
jgi:hypothetical protein